MSRARARADREPPRSTLWPALERARKLIPRYQERRGAKSSSRKTNSRVRERDAVSCISRMREKYKVNPILGLTKGFTICTLESRSTIGQVGDHDEDHNCSESEGRRR